MTIKRPSPEQLAAATPEEIAALAADCLALLEPGRQPLSLYDQLRRLMMRTTVEIVPLRLTSKRPEVLLGQRAVNSQDQLSGLLNLPGSAVGINEPLKHYRDYATPCDRTLRQEFKGSVRRTGSLYELDHGMPDGIPTREHKFWFTTTVDLAEGHEAPIDGAFYEIEEVIANPPENLVGGHAKTLLRGFHFFQRLQGEASGFSSISI